MIYEDEEIKLSKSIVEKLINNKSTDAITLKNIQFQ